MNARRRGTDRIRRLRSVFDGKRKNHGDDIIYDDQKTYILRKRLHFERVLSVGTGVRIVLRFFSPVSAI